MVKISQRAKTAPDIDNLRGTSHWTKIKFFWHKGWVEIPLIMSCIPLTITATAGFAFYTWFVMTHDMTRKYNFVPRVFRPDDPRVSRIRYDSWFDQ